MDKSSYFNSFHRNSHGELRSTFFDPFVVKHRKRTSKTQLKILEKTFETNIKPDAILRNQLSEQLGMTPRSVQVWFQNRRAKQKKAKCKQQNENKEAAYGHHHNKSKYEYMNHMMPPPDESMMFMPIAPLEKTTTFCNDRYPISPVHDKALKKMLKTEMNMMHPGQQRLEKKTDYPPVDSLDSSWIDMRPHFENNEGIADNTIMFDPNNFFC